MASIPCKIADVYSSDPCTVGIPSVLFAAPELKRQSPRLLLILEIDVSVFIRRLGSSGHI